MKILVVHRQKEVDKQVKSVLCLNTSIIRFCDSGLDGLLASRIEQFDLIICSTELPVVTGFEMVRSLRTGSLNKHTPVVFLTDEISAEMRQLGEALGAMDMFSASEIGEKLPEILFEKIKETPDHSWEDLLTIKHRMN